MTRAIFTSAANRDVKRALDYYKREAGVKVADNFINFLESKVAGILRNPESYRIVTKDLRCANLDRYPYQIVFRIANASTSELFRFVITNNILISGLVGRRPAASNGCFSELRWSWTVAGSDPGNERLIADREPIDDRICSNVREDHLIITNDTLNKKVGR